MSEETQTRPLIDWSVAASTGAFLVRSGPAVPREEADLAVTELRELTVDAEGHVRELTGLGAGLPLLAGSVGVQTGVVLSFLASRVLGQYDPFAGPEGDGKLLLVAPNVVAAQQAMNVPGKDFRMWVCLHECTHRLQFTAVGWLRGYFADEVERLIGGLAGTDIDGLANLVSSLPDRLKEVRKDRSFGLAELFQSPQQREVFDRLIALSTLLEGHADYVMDAVCPEVVPTVETIGVRFTARRKGGGLFDKLLRSLLGVEAKIRQYAEGAAFTRQVIDTVWMDNFNTVWRSPNTLPTRTEIAEPDKWIRRLHG